jgi:hypothetical protein
MRRLAALSACLGLSHCRHYTARIVANRSHNVQSPSWRAIGKFRAASTVNTVDVVLDRVSWLPYLRPAEEIPWYTMARIFTSTDTGEHVFYDSGLNDARYSRKAFTI